MACVQCSTRQDDLTHVHTVTVKLGLFHVSVSQQQEGRRPISCQRGTLIMLIESTIYLSLTQNCSYNCLVLLWEPERLSLMQITSQWNFPHYHYQEIFR